MALELIRSAPKRINMQLQTILNRIEKHKGFVNSNVGFNTNEEVKIEVPLWSIAVFLVYSMRVIDCKEWDRVDWHRRDSALAWPFSIAFTSEEFFGSIGQCSRPMGFRQESLRDSTTKRN
jgi:hypothetical protein